MRIAWVAPTYNDIDAAFRYRVKMPMAFLSAQGHPQAIFDPDQMEHYDSVIFGRAYNSPHVALASQLVRMGKAAIIDLSDNHFYNPFDLRAYHQVCVQLMEMLKVVSGIICTTPTLASAVRSAISETKTTPIRVVGDYCEVVSLPARPTNLARPTLLWFGNSGSLNAPNGLTDLYLIADQLAAAWKRKAFDLVVCSSDPVRYALQLADLGVPTRFVPWSLATFPGVLAAADAVLIPTTRSPFTDAKSANRLTLSLLAGVPTLATGIPSYMEFGEYCHLDDWENGLRQVLEHPVEARRRAALGGAYVRSAWSDQRVTQDWLSAIQDLARIPTKAR